MFLSSFSIAETTWDISCFPAHQHGLNLLPFLKYDLSEWKNVHLKRTATYLGRFPLMLVREYPVNAPVPQCSIFGPKLSLLYINDISDVICNTAIYADDTTRYSKCDLASDLWQQLELTSEFESDLRYTVDWGGKWLVDFDAGKTQLVSFDQSYNTGAIDVKMDVSVLEEKSSFKKMVLDWVGALTPSLLLKLPSRKLEP